MKVKFQYLKNPYSDNVLAMLGCEQIQQNENSSECIPLHFHNLMEIAICRMGTGEIIIEGKIYKYAEETVMVIPRNVSHTIVSNVGEKSFWEFLYIDPEIFFKKLYKTEERKRKNIIDALECRPFYKSQGTANELRVEINLIMDQYRKKEYGYKKCVNGLLYALYMEILKINHIDHCNREHSGKEISQKIKTIGKALDYIEDNFAQDLHMSDIAQAVFVSEAYLRRLFMECCETSPMHYVKEIKIENACELLKSEDIAIHEVAYKVGYSNMSTFINNFKQITGVTPKKWRQNQEQNRGDIF